MQHRSKKPRTSVARWGQKELGAALVASFVTGCGGDALVSEYETSTEALTRPDAPGTEFGEKEGLLIPGPGAPSDITHYLSPAVCSDADFTFLTVTADSAGRYRTLFYFGSGWRTDNWAFQDYNKQFASKPACTMLERGLDDFPQFLIVGKGKDNLMHSSTGFWDSNPLPDGTFHDPTPAAAFQAISPSNFGTGGGIPALATDESFSQVALAFIDNSSGMNRVRARRHLLPFGMHVWEPSILAPALPSGWTALGAPAIVWLNNWAGHFQLVVRVRNSSSQTKLIAIYFNGWGFSGIIPGSPPTWSETGITGVDSDPALAYSAALNTVTLYFRRGNQPTGNKLFQTSGFSSELGTNALREIVSQSVYPPGSSPAAISRDFELSEHMVVARNTNNQLSSSFATEDWLVP